ncbi:MULTISPECIES: hypothetical protein [Mycobacterium]|uniref:Uncharacterized protein n=1 Tax=Mycobacterium persicum TaxID=1487726 RepID=A0A1X0LDT3_9MYCO|nr:MULTISPECIES: hypothetical protein [Mycobacterium]ARG55412.1 hypothetical protein B1T43_05475 [Mycobacterium kansasii]KZS85974.1 hypothetical protein A4G31_22310 [Mycobacterium persicum]ORB47903.1 hypothetical protein BST40_14630 [Mycobacterium persicum]ORB91602.1 hypothetical protein B1T49_22845 [Mycobacterium persicum]ORB96969.1 hypothetical protein B1T44_23460 [Mycobacterium persicum]
MRESELIGTARLIGSVPNTVAPVFGTGDIELYEVDPPLCGFRVIAASQTLWAIRIHTPPTPPEDPVSTALYGVTGGEGLNILAEQNLPGSADGRSPARALAGIGYRVL